MDAVIPYSILNDVCHSAIIIAIASAIIDDFHNSLLAVTKHNSI